MVSGRGRGCRDGGGLEGFDLFLPFLPTEQLSIRRVWKQQRQIGVTTNIIVTSQVAVVAPSRG